MGTAGGGLLLWTFHTLGPNLTDTVVTRKTHTLVTHGPYRWVRHPSYTGSLLAFAGVGLLLSNYVSVVLITLPILAVFLHRMRVEEAALLQGLGDPYRAYMLRTTRLIPGIY